MQHAALRRSIRRAAWLPALALLNLPSSLLAQEAAENLCRNLTQVECRSLATRNTYALFSDNSVSRMHGSKVVATSRLNVFDEDLIGIDFRPADPRPDKTLVHGVTDAGNIVILATDLNPNAFSDRVGGLNPVFEGGYHSLFDFNPVGDSLRIIGSNNQNFVAFNRGGELNVTAVQTGITYVSGDPQAARDANLTAGAYTNNVAGATTTTFFALDYTSNTLVTSADLTNGSSNTSTGRMKTVGRIVDDRGMPINILPGAGMDIYTDSTAGNIAIIANGKSLYLLNLASVNAARRVGATQDVVLRELLPDANSFFSPTRVPGSIIDIAITPAPVRRTAADLKVEFDTNFEDVSPFVNGQPKIFAAKVTNLGPDPQPNTMVFPSLPNFKSVAVKTTQGSCPINTQFGIPIVSCNLGTLGVGQSAFIQVTASQLDENTVGISTFDVSFSTNGPEINGGFGVIAVLVEEPDPSNNRTLALTIPVRYR